MITRQQAYLRLAVILLIYGLLACLHTVWLPFHKAADEIAHFRYSRFIAQTGRLPLNLEERAAADYKANQPPLYHALVALVAGWSDSPGPPFLKFVWESPRAQLAEQLLDTKRLANTEDEFWPYRGTVLMWHLGRWLNIGVGAGVILLAFLSSLQLFSGNYRLAVWAAAILAFTPAFIFYSSALSYEPLLALMVGLYLWLLLRIVRGDIRTLNFIGLGVLLGLAVTTKYVAVILPVEVVLVFIYLAYQGRENWYIWLRRLAITGGAALLFSGWWFLFLLINFNEVAQHGLLAGLLKPIIAGGGDTTQNYLAFTLTGGEIGAVQQAEILDESFATWAWQFYRSFWVEELGTYPLSPLMPLLIGGFCLVTAMGLVKVWRNQPHQRIWLGLLVGHLLLFLLPPLLRFLIQGHLNQTAQGRHLLFPVATALPLLLISGWQGWPSLKIRQGLALTLAGLLVSWSLAQLGWIDRYYRATYLPIRTTPEILTQIPHPLEGTFAGQIQLLGYDLQVVPETAGLKVTLYWRSLAEVEEDYLLSLKLVKAGAPELVWTVYPFNGRYPTRLWERREILRDEWLLPLVDLPEDVYQVELQLQGRSLPVEGAETISLGNITFPGAVTLTPEIRLPVSVAGRQVVEGVTLWQAGTYYQLSLPVYNPRMMIPLVWTGQPGENERVQWLLINEGGQLYPSHSISPHFDYFQVGLGWPSGLYRLRVEVWQGETVAASQETGPLLRVFNERPRRVKIPPISQPLQANFANQIQLLGYDLPTRTVSPGQGVPLTLYWQSLRTTDRSYTVFTKLFDQQQKLWANLERLPADGYPTFYWLENEVVVDSFQLPLEAAMPEGIYWLNVGLYEEVNGQALSLPLVSGAQAGEVTSVTFGPIKVGGPPPGVTLARASPDFPLHINLAGQISLKGYDEPVRQADRLQVQLYWESLAPLQTNYTTFIHLRNQEGQIVAQMDRPLTDNVYPSSVWSVGEIVPDQITVPLPETLPAGDYTLVAGLYDFNTGRRLPMTGSTHDSIVLTQVRVD